jgi:tetratricopeptide (TPR) repeat protein
LFGEAYYQRAIYRYSKNQYESSLEDLNIANDLMPFDPRIYLAFAKLNLAMGENKIALENALEASRLDITLLETYLVLGKAYLANENPEKGLTTIQTYGRYQPDDPQYLALLGGTLYLLGEDFQAALEVLDRAKSLDNDLVDAFYYHGLTSLKLRDPNQAVNDFYIARNLMPENLEYTIWFGISLYEDERYREAFNLFDLVNPLKLNDEQLVRYHYYKAKAGMELSLIQPVKDAWLALLDMPDESVPSSWLKEAEEYLAPPTITPTSSKTATATNTETAKPTATTTPTPTSTATITPSLTAIPTDTSTPSPTTIP